jgi:transcriptional regulator with GAF, ATPase, and Fis domain
MTETDFVSWRRFLIGESQPMLEICDIIHLIASKRCTLLITGETGTGKEVIARAIHAASNRYAFPLVAVNCTAIPANLIESELFGHTKGAFTGAQFNRVGRFEQAHRGTIFLDEIGDLPLEAQAKLLRVLQEREFERVGSSATFRVDVRVIAASNVNLEIATHERKFREDLYYRLNVVPIHMPPLRERRSDIRLLVSYFLEKISDAEQCPRKRVSNDALEYLQSLDWPGNVRQLEHVAQMAVALSGDREVLRAADFCVPQRGVPKNSAQPGSPLLTLSPQGVDFEEVVGEFERSLLNQALALTAGNKSQAADLLRIKRTTLLAKLKAFEEPNTLAMAS